jgi:hypothetical protein
MVEYSTTSLMVDVCEQITHEPVSGMELIRRLNGGVGSSYPFNRQPRESDGIEDLPYFMQVLPPPRAPFAEASEEDEIPDLITVDGTSTPSVDGQPGQSSFEVIPQDENGTFSESPSPSPERWPTPDSLMTEIRTESERYSLTPDFIESERYSMTPEYATPVSELASPIPKHTH